MTTPFDVYMSQFEGPNGPNGGKGGNFATKSAADAEFENAYWDEMTKLASQHESNSAEALFNAVFEDQTQKLAAYDPEYAEILEAEQVKMAFNQGFEELLVAAQNGQLG